MSDRPATGLMIDFLPMALSQTAGAPVFGILMAGSGAGLAVMCFAALALLAGFFRAQGATEVALVVGQVLQHLPTAILEQKYSESLVVYDSMPAQEKVRRGLCTGHKLLLREPVTCQHGMLLDLTHDHGHKLTR